MTIVLARNVEIADKDSHSGNHDDRGQLSRKT